MCRITQKRHMTTAPLRHRVTALKSRFQKLFQANNIKSRRESLPAVKQYSVSGMKHIPSAISENNSRIKKPVWIERPFQAVCDGKFDVRLLLSLFLDVNASDAVFRPDGAFPCPDNPVDPLGDSAFPGIAKLVTSGCEGLLMGRSCRHFGGVIGPKAERIIPGVTV